MKQFERAELKSLSTLKLNNPNKFNAINSAFAFLVALVGFEIITSFISPFLKALTSGLGIGIALCLSIIISQVFVFLVALAFCKLKNVSLFGGGEINLRFNFAPCIPALLLSVGTMLLISPSHNYFAERIAEVQKALVGVSSLDSLSNIKITDAIFVLLYAFILAPILPAIAEEALFRGVVMSGLREFGNFFAIMLSGALFALMHGNYAQLILQFIVGCEIAFVVLINENYFMGMIMHFANNLFAVLFGIINSLILELSPLLWNLVEGLSVMIGLIMVCIAVCYYYRLTVFKNDKSNSRAKSFAFYRPDVSPRPCCLVGANESKGNRFFVDRRVVLLNDNSNFLFFAGRKFHKFTKRSNKAVFAIVLSISIVFAVVGILLNFFK